jgi:DNA-directed RNA polymerase II subunit RPB2
MKNNLGGLFSERIPYIKIDVPIIILFRALRLESDKDIMNYIVFDENDNTFKELLSPLLAFSSDYRGKEQCLKYIGNKATRGESKYLEERIRREEEILRINILSHIYIEKGNESKISHFIGYMINRLGNCSLGRDFDEDRDHYGKKRLEMYGILLSGIFR